jgi:glycine C-acetyltransferase
MVVTEGLFSMDSDSPNLVEYQRIAKKYNAYLLIDCAHDFGCMGPGGRGVWEMQGLQDRSNVILMGTGSKTLSTNIGFVACEDEHVIEYMKILSPTYMFTNAINPVQAATSLSNLRLLSSEHGNQIRNKVLANYDYLRAKLEAKGYTIYGNRCPILPLKVGNEILCRLVSRTMMDEGIPCVIQAFT